MGGEEEWIKVHKLMILFFKCKFGISRINFDVMLTAKNYFNYMEIIF